MAAPVTLPNGTSKHVAALKLAIAQGKLPPSAVSAALGISGTANFSGDILSESNAKLIHQEGYGQAGSRSWGAWEKILRTDPAVSCAIEFVKAQLRDARVDVEPADEEAQPNRKLAEDQAAYVKWNLTNALEPGWSEVIQQMAAGPLVFGFCIHETVMAQCQHKLLPGGTGFRLAKLEERLPSSVMPNGWLEEKDQLVAIRQQGVKDGKWQTVVLPAEDVLLISWNRSGNNYLGYSQFRAVWYLCKIREELAKLIGISLSREGAGIPVAYADKPEAAISKSQMKKLEKFLANCVYHENAAVVPPAGWKVEWLYSPGANKGHVVDAYNQLGRIILEQVQAQQTMLGTGATGSRAVGQVHDAVADSFIQGVATTIEDVLNGVGQRSYTGLVRRIVDANWVDTEAYPKLRITLKKDKLSAELKFAALASAITSGLFTVTAADENVAREQLGFPPIDEEDRDAEKQKKADAAMAIAQAAPAPAFPPKPGQPKPPPKPGAKLTRLAAPFVPHRELRASEKHLDLPAMAAMFDAAREAFEKGAKPLVVGMVVGVLPEIRAAMADRTIAHREIAKLPLDTSKLDAFVEDFLQKYRDAGYQHVAAELQRAKPERPLHADKKNKKPAPDNDVTLEAQRLALVRRMEARTRAAIETSAIDIVRTGGSADDVASDVIGDMLDAKTLQADGGSVTAKAYNIGRDDFINEHADEVDSMELSAVLDADTCDYCEEHDGDEFELGSSDEEAMTPPLNDCGDGYGQCRCVMVANFTGGNGFKDVEPDDGEGAE